jgi:hypothetical protein
MGYFTSTLPEIQIPSSAEVICGRCFRSHVALASVTFECESHFGLFEAEVFPVTGLTVAKTLSSVWIVSASCLDADGWLTLITFEHMTEYRRFENETFSRNDLTAIQIP